MDFSFSSIAIHSPIANMATIPPKLGFSVATPLLRAGSVSFQVFRASQYQLDQGRNKVYFFITDPVFLPQILIPDHKNVENFNP